VTERQLWVFALKNLDPDSISLPFFREINFYNGKTYQVGQLSCKRVGLAILDRIRTLRIPAPVGPRTREFYALADD
jgi:hypothetical protein